MNVINTAQLPQKAPEFDLKDLLEAGCHFGHQVRKGHPKMQEWIYEAREGIHIFDLAKTAEQLAHAYNFAYQLGSEGKQLLMVGTKRQARPIIEEAAQEEGIHSITARWLGGFLTNWGQVGKSLKRMLEIEEGLKTNQYDMYTKFERVQLDKEASRLERFFGGVRSLKKLPDAIFIVDPHKEDIVVRECTQMESIPVFALADSNADPRKLDLVIPANDDAHGSIKLVVDTIAAGYKAGKAAQK